MVAPASSASRTGVLAILVSASLCAWLLRRNGRTSTVVLLLVWMVFGGCFMALPQVIGPVHPPKRHGKGDELLRSRRRTKTVMALGALAVMPLAALWLTRRLLCTAASQDEIAGPSARARFVFLPATLPAVVALPLIALFRVPREIVKVLGLPLVVTMIGVAWMQA